MSEGESPAEIKVGPVSIPYAVVGVVVVVTGAVLVMGGLGVAGTVMNEPPGTDCALGKGEVLGWVELDVGRMSKIGRTHTLDRRSPVLGEKGKERTRVCTLPRGARIEVRESDRGRQGTWLAVHGDAVTLPR